MASRRRVEKTVHGNEKIVVVKDAAPKSGTELTREKLSENLRSLNSKWTKRTGEKPAQSH
jgi:hypothetical protein